MRNTQGRLDSNALLHFDNDTQNLGTSCIKKGVFVMSHVFSFMLGYFISAHIYADASTGSCL